MTPLNVLTVAGSLRAASHNKRLLEAAARLAPATLRLSRYDELGAVPLFNEDVEAVGLPAGVQKLCQAIRAADGLLVATPEYNQSLPGVLKNAIDWLSRPACNDVLAGKVVGIIGVTSGQWGTRFAQAALRHVLFATESVIAPGMGLFLRDATRQFDSEGDLRDADTREALARYLAEFAGVLQRARSAARADGRPETFHVEATGNVSLPQSLP